MKYILILLSLVFVYKSNGTALSVKSIAGEDQEASSISPVLQALHMGDYNKLDTVFLAPLWLEHKELKTEINQWLGRVNANLENPVFQLSRGENEVGKQASITYASTTNMGELELILTYTQEDDAPIVRTVQIYQDDREVARFPQFYDKLKPKIEAIEGFSSTTPNVEIIKLYQDAILYIEAHREKAQFYFKDLKDILSSYYGGLAWYYVLENKGIDAIIASKQGLIYSPKVWINSNLAHGYLITGQFEEAKTIYLKHKDEKYKGQSMLSMYLSDFQEMKATGITTNNIDEMISILNKS